MPTVAWNEWPASEPEHDQERTGARAAHRHPDEDARAPLADHGRARAGRRGRTATRPTPADV